MLIFLFSSLAFGNALPDVESPEAGSIDLFEGEQQIEIAPFAHRMAVAGRIAAASGAVTSTVLFLPSAMACIGADPSCGFFVGGMGLGLFSLWGGLNLEGIGSFAYLYKHRRAGSGPGIVAGVGLMAVGVGGFVAGCMYPYSFAGGPFYGLMSMTAGVVVMDVQHQILHDRTVKVAMSPFVDPSRRIVGLSWRF